MQRLRQLGFRSYAYDIRYGGQFDIGKETVVQSIIRRILAGDVPGVMIAVPCATFSTARDCAKVIRTHELPWGVAGLSGRDKLQVEDVSPEKRVAALQEGRRRVAEMREQREREQHCRARPDVDDLDGPQAA